MDIATLDFETHWASDFTLSKMTPLEYVMDPRFESISLSIKVNDYPTDVLFGEAAIRKVLKKLDWTTKGALGHNMSGFDAYVLAYRYGVRPRMWLCTMAMARPLHAKTTGLGLGKLVDHYARELTAMGISAKKDNTILMNTKGKRLADFTDAEREQMAKYNREDVEQCYGLFKILRRHYSAKELWQIDALTRMRTEPQFELDIPLLETAASVERDRKRAALLDLAGKLGVARTDEAMDARTPDEIEEDVRSRLASAPKFSELLTSLGVEVPMKPSPTNPDNEVPALAKTDEAFIALQEHDNPLVAAAARARLDVKSTLLETRIQKFLTAGRLAGGMLPVPIKYCGADTTGRDSGEEYNCQNLPAIRGEPKPAHALRHSMRAPRGKKVIVADQSGIELRVNHFLWKVPSSMALYQQDAQADLYKAFAAARYQKTPEDVTKSERQLAKLCLAEDTLVLTSSGLKPIQSVSVSDPLWDGVEWVAHDGPVFMGEKEVISYDGITATPDHEVWVSDGRRIPLQEAAAQSLRLARTGAGRVPLGFGGACGPDGSPEQGVSLAPPIGQAKRRVWDILNAGPRNRFTANERLVSNCQLGLGFGAGWRTFMRVVKIMGGLDLSEAESESLVDAWRAEYADIVRGWRTCHDALTYINAGQEFQVDPWGLVHTCAEGLHLPSGRLIRYPDLRREDVGGGKTEWVYAHGRHKARIYAGKITENCIAGGTLVLTDSGWKAIEHVTPDDSVHDGVEFVRHAGTVFKSVQECVSVDGVRMTPDHEVLTDDGWIQASQVQRPYRPDLRGADGDFPVDAVRQDTRRVADGRPGTRAVTQEPVYDILNCGPRQRFVVKGDSGPFVVHNCVQALARDSIFDCAVEFFKRTGLRPALRVHDELVYVVDESNADELLAELQTILRTPPTWWPQLVVWSEGDVADTYGAAK